MSLYTGCTTAASLTAIPVPTCAESLAQTQRIIFQRLNAAGVRNELTIVTVGEEPQLKATWTALKAAADSTKVVSSPIMGAPSTDENGFREFGSGNEVPDGIAIPLATNPTPFTARIYASRQDVIAQLKALAGETLQVFLVDSEGRIAGETDSVTTPTTFRGFKIRGFKVSDKVLGGFDSPDYNTIGFELLPDWSDRFYMVTPTNFDALNTADL